MKKIFKYEITNANVEVAVKVPEGAIPISVIFQGGWPCIYYMFDTDKEFTTEMRRILALGTGIPWKLEFTKHIGTVQDEDSYVWHVFEL